MKRYRMVEVLRESFIKHMNSHDVRTDDEMYSLILQDLEDAGMLPPTYRYWNSKNPNDVNERGVPKDLQHSPFNGDFLNSWEE